MNLEAKKIINQLNLQPHPEGGYFKEVYRADEIIKNSNLPERYSGDRNFSTSIYFLLEGNQISKFHRLKSDEIWFFHSGSSITIHFIDEFGNYSKQILGSNLIDEKFQITIHKGNWFAAELNDKSLFSLISCVVSPGFDFSDFELAEKEKLIKQFPQHKEIILKLT